MVSNVTRLPGTSIFANKLSFRSFRATLNASFIAPVRLLPVTFNCMHMGDERNVKFEIGYILYRVAVAVEVVAAAAAAVGAS